MTGGPTTLATWIRVAWELAPKRRVRRHRVAALPKALVTINRQLRLLTRLLHDLRAVKVTRATLDGLGTVCSWGLIQGVQPDWRWQFADNHAVATQQPWWSDLEAAAKDRRRKSMDLRRDLNRKKMTAAKTRCRPFEADGGS